MIEDSAVDVSKKNLCSICPSENRGWCGIAGDRWEPCKDFELLLAICRAAQVEVLKDAQKQRPCDLPIWLAQQVVNLSPIVAPLVARCGGCNAEVAPGRGNAACSCGSRVIKA